MKFVAAISALAIALGGLAPAAFAQPAPQPAPSQAPAIASIKAEVIILHATNEGKGIDAHIPDLPQLKKPPFSAYDTYTLVGRPVLALDRGKTASQKLPNDGRFEATFKDVSADGQKVVIGAALFQPDGAKFVEMSVTSAPGGVFFVAGPAYKGGILVLAIRLRPA